MTAHRRIDIEELRRLADTGMSCRAMAKSLGVNAKSVADAARRVGIVIVRYDARSTVTKFWLENTAKAVELREEGLSASQIGAKIGCSKNAVIGMFNRLGLCKPVVEGFGDSPFWQEHEEVLLELQAAGWLHAKIGQRFGVSKQAVQFRLSLLRDRADAQRRRDQRRRERNRFPPPGHCLFPNEHEPTDPEFAFCGAEQQPYSSYCADHHRVAWRPVERQPWAMSGELK